MLNRNSLRAYLVSLGPRMQIILNDHEAPDGVFIPHSFAWDFVTVIANSEPLKVEDNLLLIEVVRTFMQEGDSYIRDLLYASLFPGLEEHPHLLSAFASENKTVFSYYQDWLDL